MNQKPSLSRLELVEPPRFSAATTEGLLTGGRALRHAFMQIAVRFAGRDMPLIRAGDRDAALVLIRSGFAFRSCVLADGRRSILQVLLSGDIGGLDNLVLARAGEDITAASRVGYHILPGSAVRDLLADRSVGMWLFALLAEARCRADRLAASIGRLDAQARICVLLLDIHDRLLRRGLINRPSFNLPLTQEQMADHLGLTLVHVNRTLRRLREERLVMLDRQVVVIQDVQRLRDIAQGLPQAADLPDPLPAADRLPPLTAKPGAVL